MLNERAPLTDGQTMVNVQNCLGSLERDHLTPAIVRSQRTGRMGHPAASVPPRVIWFAPFGSCV